MREKKSTGESLQSGSKAAIGADLTVAEVNYDEKKFFESFYAAGKRGTPTDRNTIGAITDPEARFHYNATENSIIRAISRHITLPEAAMVEAWRFVQSRSDLRLLDVGSGTGHWIDFFMDVFFVSEAVSIEITDSMAGFLREKYANVNGVDIHQCDIGASNFDQEILGGKFDYISAIGVMFHLVDDEKWLRALAALAQGLKKDGLLLVGGEFAARTENVQFHKVDEFKSWREHSKAEIDSEVRVNKRVRSFADWNKAATQCGLVVSDLVRSDFDRSIMTPENDILVLRHAAQST